MKIIIALCSVVLFVGSFGADEDGLRSSTDEREERPRFTEGMCSTNESSLYGNVFDAGNDCMRITLTEETLSQIQNAKTLEEFRDSFKKFCQKQSLVRSCLVETTDQIEICRNETLLNIYKIYRDTIETFLDLGCNEDGEQLANFYFEMTDTLRDQDIQHLIVHFKKCSDRFRLMLSDLLRTEIDTSSKVYILHKEMVVFVECTSRLELEQSLKDRFKNFTDVIINKMKCIHPRDGTLVPCVTIDASSISTHNVCDLKTFGTEMSLYDVLEEVTVSCMMNFHSYLDEDADNNDKIRTIVGTNCKEISIPYCHNLYNIISDICLNNTQQKEFHLLGDFIKSAYEEACFEDGRRLSEILYEVHRLKRTGQGHAVWDCIDDALSTRNVTDEHGNSSKNMRFYHKMEAFKGCLVNRLQGDQTSVVAATSLIDELLKKVKCVHPAEGTTVLCETLHVNKV